MDIAAKLAQIFRGLIVVFFLSAIAPALIDVVFFGGNASTNPLDSMSPLFAWIMAGIFIAYCVLALVSAIGLLFFKNWARVIFTSVFCAGWLLELVALNERAWGVDEFFSEMQYAAMGALVALMWASHLSERFRSNAIRGEATPDEEKKSFFQTLVAFGHTRTGKYTGVALLVITALFAGFSLAGYLLHESGAHQVVHASPQHVISSQHTVGIIFKFVIAPLVVVLILALLSTRAGRYILGAVVFIVIGMLAYVFIYLAKPVPANKAAATISSPAK